MKWGEALPAYDDHCARFAVDFDDLLLYAVRLFDVPEMLQKYAGRYQHVLVDEFQDTNPVQYALAQKLASQHGNITVVGDPDQSIYSWRAADVRNVQHFERDFPGCTVYLLEQNYRSTQAILEAADAVIGKNPGRHERKLWTERQGGDLITTYDAYNDEEEGEFVAKETTRLATDGRTTRSRVMYRRRPSPPWKRPWSPPHPYRSSAGALLLRRESRTLSPIPARRRTRGRSQPAALINAPPGLGDRTVVDGEFAREKRRYALGACEGVAAGFGAALPAFRPPPSSIRPHRNRLQADSGRRCPIFSTRC